MPILNADEEFGGAPAGGVISADEAFGPPAAPAQSGLQRFLDAALGPVDPVTKRRRGLLAGLARQTVGIDRETPDAEAEAIGTAAGAIPMPGIPRFFGEAMGGEVADVVSNARRAGAAESIPEKVGFALGAIPFVGTGAVSAAETAKRGDTAGLVGELATLLPVFKILKGGAAGLSRAATGRLASRAAAKAAAQAAEKEAAEAALQQGLIDRILQTEASEFPIAPPREAGQVFEGSAEQASRNIGINGPETVARMELERPLPQPRQPSPSGLDDALEGEAQQLVPEDREFLPSDVFEGQQTHVFEPASESGQVLPTGPFQTRGRVRRGEPPIRGFLDNSIQMRREVPPFAGEEEFVPEGFSPETGRPFTEGTSRLTAPPPREGPDFPNPVTEEGAPPGRAGVPVNPDEPVIRLSREDLPDELAGPPEPALPARATLPGEAGEGLEGLAISQPGRRLPEAVIQGEPFSLTEQITPAEATKLAEAIERARGAITATERLRGQELGRRFGEAEKSLSRSATGAGLEEARARLSGKLPSAEFAPLDLTPVQLESYRAAVARAPVETGLKLAADDGLKKLAGGEVLQRSELAAIEKILGPQVGEAAAAGTAEQGMGWLMALLDLPRALFAGGPELSPWGRQLGISVAGNPRIGLQSLEKGVRALFDPRKKVSEAVQEQFYRDLAERANNKVYDQAGLKFVEIPTAERALEGLKEGVAINPIVNKLPVLGPVYRRSARASALMINAQRADVFDAMTAPFISQGMTVKSNPELFKAIANWVNVTTGRGGLGPLEKHAGLLSTLLFSPRYAAARVQLPSAFLAMKRADPRLAAKATKDLFAWFASRAAILTSIKTAKHLGVPGFQDAVIDDNPLSPDWGKARIGKARLDVWGGHMQYARTLYRLSQAAVGNPSREKLSGDQVDETTLQLLTQWAASQANPGTRIALQLADTPGGMFQGVTKDAFGNEVPMSQILADNFVSGIVDGTREIIVNEPRSAWMLPFLAVGAGTQTYDEPAQFTPEERGQLRQSEALARENRKLRKEGAAGVQKVQPKTPAERLASQEKTNTRLQAVREILEMLRRGDRAGARAVASRVRRESKGKINLDIRDLERALGEEVRP